MRTCYASRSAKCCTTLAQLLAALPAVDAQLVEQHREVQIVPVAAAEQADAQHHGHVQRRRDLPGRGGKLAPSAPRKSTRTVALPGRAAVGQHRHQRAAAAGPRRSRSTTVVPSWRGLMMLDAISGFRCAQDARQRRTVLGVEHHPERSRRCAAGSVRAVRRSCPRARRPAARRARARSPRAASSRPMIRMSNFSSRPVNRNTRSSVTPANTWKWRAISSSVGGRPSTRCR